MKRVVLTMAMALTAATVFAQWHMDVTEDVMTGAVTRYIYAEAQMSTGTLRTPFIMVMQRDSGYTALVDFRSYSVARDVRRIAVRFGDSLEQVAARPTHDSNGVIFADALGMMERMGQYDEIPMQLFTATGHRMVAMWSMDGYQDAVAWLTGHVE